MIDTTHVTTTTLPDVKLTLLTNENKVPTSTLVNEFETLAEVDKRETLEDDFFAFSQGQEDSLVTDYPIDEFQTADTIDETCVDWLLDNQLAYGKLHYIVGQPGTMKSQLMVYIASIVSNGGNFWNGQQCIQGGIVYVSLEDGLSDTLIPRMKAYGTDLSRVLAVQKIKDNSVKLTGATKERDFHFPEDIPMLERMIKAVSASFVVIDTLERACDNFGNNNHMQKIMMSLGTLADETGACIVLLGHFKKGKYNEENIGTAIGGAECIQGYSRSVQTVTKDKTKKIVSNWQQYKHNLGPTQDMIAYTLATDTVGRKVISFDIQDDEHLTLASSEQNTHKRIAMLIILRGYAMTPLAIAQQLDIKHSTIKVEVRRMLDMGRLVQDGYGLYNVPMQYRRSTQCIDSSVAPVAISQDATAKDNTINVVLP